MTKPMQSRQNTPILAFKSTINLRNIWSKTIESGNKSNKYITTNFQACLKHLFLSGRVILYTFFYK